MHSLINIIERRGKNGNSYYQARFFEKSGRCYAAKSYPGIKSRTEIYLLARKALEEGIIPSISPLEAKTYGILTLEEVKQILAIEENEPHILRAKLIVLLGITCGLGVGEIQQLRKENINYQHDMLKVTNRNFSRIIPYIDTIRDLLKKIDETYPDHVFVIPNLNDIRRPCDPIAITRGLSIILEKINVSHERNILPSGLQETFVLLLHECKTDFEIIDDLCGFSKYTQNESLDMPIRNISNLMILIKDLETNPLMYMNWL